MIEVPIVIGILIAVAVVILLAKFAEGTVSAVITVVIILVGLFVVFGAPDADLIKSKIDSVKGTIPVTSSSVLASEDLEIISLDNLGSVLVIGIKNTGLSTLKSFEVSVGGEEASVVMSNKILPGTRGKIAVNRNAQKGDEIIVRGRMTSDKEVFGTEEIGITGDSISSILLY